MVAHEEYDPEEPVVEAVRNGDHAAFKELLVRQDRWVRGVIYGVLADADRIEDVSQHVWTTVWQKIPELRDVRRWRPWLYRLARNAAVDAGRDETKRRKLGATPVETDRIPDDAESPSERIQRAEDHQAVLRAIESLTPLYREPFTLRHLEGWSYREIANVLDVPIDTVETRLVRARRLLREALRGKV